MSQIKLVHNPRCSKSRKALEILSEKNIEPEIILYLESGLTLEFVKSLSQKLNLPVNKFIRKKEDEYKNSKANWDNEEEAILELIKHPKILERPIVINGDKAVVARPPENLLEII